jgi:type I restriction enzyme M protein
MDSTVKSIIDRIWESFWTGGITNPLTVIEQITYLLYIKGLDDVETAREKDDELLKTKSKKIFDKEHQNCRWGIFKDFEASKMYN